MRIFRIAVATTFLSIASSVIMLTASAAQAAPFTYSSVNVGFRNACAVTSAGKVLCWGDNSEQQLSTTRTDRYINSPVIVPLPEAATSVDTSYGYTVCARGVSGRAYCWGTGGHLGSYFTTTSRSPVTVEFPNDMRVTDVQNGSGNACALDASRALWCWGDPLSLGDGGTDAVRVPVKLSMPDNAAIAQYDMGLNDTCVVTTQGHMYCWGPNTTTRYWWSTSGYLPTEIAAPNGTTWASAQTESARNCGITSIGTAYCFGDNYNGNFGNNTYDDSASMTKMIVPNNESVQSLHMGSYATCIVTTTAKIWCVGEGGNGQLGTGTTLGGKTWRTPLLPDGVALTGLSMNHTGTCGINVDGQLWCWSYIATFESSTGYSYGNLAPIARPLVGSPEVTAPLATTITTRSAVITASASPFGFATGGSIEYSTDESFTSSTIVPLAMRSAEGSNALLTLSTILSGLAPRTTYYARAHARNEAGEATGAVVSFRTLGSEPTILELSTSRVTGNEAVVLSQIDPGLLRTSAVVEVSESADFSTIVSSTPVADLNGSGIENRSTPLHDLAPQHAYFVRATATNVLGTTMSEPIVFSTVGNAPSIHHIAATSSNTSVSAQVAINTGNTRGTITFELSRSESFSVIAHTQSNSFSSSGPQSFSFTAHGLTLATNYWVRATATNALGSATSAIVSIRTKGSAPVVGTLAVEPILQGAILSFPLDTTGINTMAVVDIAKNGDFTDYTSHFAFSGVNDGSRTVSVTVNRLNPTVEYFARVSAINSLGQTVSNIVSFRTVRPFGLVINDDEVSTTNPHVILNFRYPADTVAIRISNNEDFSGARIYTPASSIPWDLITADEPSSLRTIYVQFINSRGSSTMYTDEITLESDITTPDEEAPVITSLRSVDDDSYSMVAALSLSSQKKMRRFIVAVSDKASGVTRIQTKVGSRIVTQKVDALRRGEYSLAFARNVKSFAIRVIDRSGNASKWKKITVR